MTKNRGVDAMADAQMASLGFGAGTFEPESASEQLRWIEQAPKAKPVPPDPMQTLGIAVIAVAAYLVPMALSIFCAGWVVGRLVKHIKH